ncbi:hypothetical protein SO802_028382 [Lithocarpus litseifolius]|uniref:Uncharacterized protein n=1 Tax=Lithocarpus litseifolius TaxID=425828 RepID=A0AAW2BS08_9ROSI
MTTFATSKPLESFTNPTISFNPSTLTLTPLSIDNILPMVDIFKSKSFTEPDFPRLAYLCPQLFSTNFDPTDFTPVFVFLATEESLEFCLQPTLDYLRRLGMKNLSSPSNLNAYLLNTRDERLREKIGFLKSIGFPNEEAARACFRLPAMFGYSIDNNMWSKFMYLVDKRKIGVWKN